MAGGGGGGSLWKVVLGVGLVLCAAAFVLHRGHSGPEWLVLALSGLGGLAVIFGSCEAMILCVDGLGERLGWNPFVAGTMAGLASNVPEIVMLGFVVAAEPRVAFVVACLTLHVNALVFGIYSALLPRDETGDASLPQPIVKLATDLQVCGAGVFLSTGVLMLTLRAFDAGDHRGEGLGAGDLYAIGFGLLVVEVIYVRELVRRFGQAAKTAAAAGAPAPAAPPTDAPSWGAIVGYGVLGTLTSLIGGHAVGDFAGGLVGTLTRHGYSEMVGAIVVSVFAGCASYLMVATAHVKGKIDLALSNVSGAINQVPFVILPATAIMMAAFAQTGIIDHLPHGGVLSIDLETTAVVLFGFPTLLILWNSISDDGRVNTLETTIMVVLFGMIIYLLAQHGAPQVAAAGGVAPVGGAGGGH